MQNANTIIEYNDLFKQLRRYRLMRKMAFKSLENLNLQEYFSGVSIKNQKLFFRFSHVSIKTEFDYKKDSIKAKLREEYRAHIQECKEYNIFFRDIDCFLVRNPTQEKPFQPIKKTRYYKERAKGNFKINPDSPFKEHFEKIREIIKANLAKKALSQ